MAIGAMKALQARGVRISDDIVIADVNEEVQSHIITLPLTTSPLHFFEQGRTATVLALDLLAGRAVPEVVVLPTQLLIRQSCGCPAPIVVQAAAVIAPTSDTALEIVFAARRTTLQSELLLLFGEAPRLQAAARLKQLFDAFVADVPAASSAATFLATLTEVIRQSTAAGESVSTWHEVISALQRHAPRICCGSRHAC
jgi:hypothetical protein